ncbi:MAG: RagB/SusD family nutrient uptake outer membrane protein [Bacteroidales bacterium]|nr:RagB/SusD family nutrient uptake outer membrane protein [Bacteroidales bacterium]
MKKIQIILSLIVLLAISFSCKDYLDVKPQGIVGDAELSTPQNIDGFVISAYAQLANDHYTIPNLLWPYGDLRAGDSYKGGDGPADISIFHAFEVFSTIQPDMSAYAPSVLGDINNKKWERQFVGISRANLALARLKSMTEAEYPLKTRRMAEMRFLRGHYYFDLKILYNSIPWFDEDASASEIEAISNVKYTSNELWDKIAEDFKYAAEILPESQLEIGRPNMFTAKAYLAKVMLYQAYEQDENYNVININTEKLSQVVDLVNEVTASGQYGLMPDFAENFLYEFENGKESVWSIQRSHQDGTLTGNLDFSAMLSGPMSNEYGCCWFHIPSQNLVNAFKTDASGLPLFDSYNQSDLNLSTNNVDSRLSHTIALPGHPWKYEPQLIYTIKDWTRRPDIYGNYSSLKENVSPDCECFERIAPFMSSSKNTILIRYADVLLWKAEALIELNQLDQAKDIINQVRQRAANSTDRLYDSLGVKLANYKIGLYTSFPDKEYARKALRWERRLELAEEGIRFFDLVRWGIAKETLDQYFASEKSKRTYLVDASFVKGKNEFLPIPQQQIILSKGLYKQNKGY